MTEQQTAMAENSAAGILEITPAGSKRRVHVKTPQKGTYRDIRDFETDWSEQLLCRLAELKGDWFVDSYQRFEHPNYLQKHIDTVVDLYGVRFDGPILDFGCGFGASSYCMIKRGATQILASDLEKSNTDFASLFFAQRGMSQLIEIRNGDIVPSLEPDSFAVIWLQAVMEHLLPDERRSYLKRFWSALRPGGVLVVTETPNRVWPIEGHTTGGTWWIPWFRPERVFERMRKAPRYSSYSDDQFYRSGIIGSSYDEILDCLGRPSDCTQVALQTGGYLRYMYAHAVRRSPARAAAIQTASAAEPIVRKVFHKPVTAFMPFLNHLVFRKSNV